MILSVFAISCRTVHMYHLNSEVEKLVGNMGNWRNVATTMKQAVKKNPNKKKTKQTKQIEANKQTNKWS